MKRVEHYPTRMHAPQCGVKCGRKIIKIAATTAAAMGRGGWAVGV